MNEVPETSPAARETAQLDREKIRKHLEARNFKRLRESLRDYDVADIGEFLGEIPVDECVSLFRMVPRSRRSEVFSYLSRERQEEMLEELPDSILTSVVNDMEPDDRTRLLEELPFEIRNKILLRLSPEERKIAWQLLSYPEGSVGRLMNPEFIALNANMRASDALETMRWGGRYPEELLQFIFVVDEEGRYLGDVTLAALVQADPPLTAVGEIMIPSQVALHVNDDREQAVDDFRKYDRPYFPVVGDGQVLLGIVTGDDVFDVAEEEASEDIYQFGGQAVLEDSYFQTSLFTLFRKRAGWLAVLFFGGTLTAAVLKQYEHLQAAWPWLVFFLPLIVASGGNTGSQAASLVIRGIAVREMRLLDWYRVLWREVLVGLGLGCVLGVLGYARAVTWGLEPVVGLVVGLALVGVVVFGAVAGSMLPFLFSRVKLDPAVISSPLLASLVDIAGVVIFYNVAVWVLRGLVDYPGG